MKKSLLLSVKVIISFALSCFLAANVDSLTSYHYADVTVLFFGTILFSNLFRVFTLK